MFQVGDLVRHRDGRTHYKIAYFGATVLPQENRPYAVCDSGVAYYLDDLVLVRSSRQDLTDIAAYYAALTE